MLEHQPSTKRLERLAMIACSVVLSATLAGCGGSGGYSAPPSNPPPPTQPPVETPLAQFISVVGATIAVANADTLEPSGIDPTPAPTTETEEPVPVP